MKFIYLVFPLLVSLNNVNSLNILGIYPYEGKSHFFVFRVLLHELANRGHNVTVISYFPEKDAPKNYHDITLTGGIVIEDIEFPISDSYFTLLMTGYQLPTMGRKNCETLLKNKRVQNLIKEKQKFDVILVEQFNSDCALGVAYKLGAPVVGTSSHILMPFHYNRLGIQDHPAYVSFHFLGGGTKPTLYQRVERTVFDIYMKTIYYWLSQRSDQNTLAQYYDDIPPLEDLAKEIRFFLLYQHLTLAGSTILPTNVIEVGGYHVTKAKPLSGDLKKFIEESEHGVIYINFGSIVKSSSLAPEKIEAILQAIKELPQRFVWKWENKNLNVDKNKVYIDSWLPQVDILGHPKTMAFYSHAGNGGTTEAIQYGVPIVAMPVFGDQPSNAAIIEERGLGVQLLYNNLNKDNLVKAFKTVLDPTFQQRAKEISAAWHDRPQSALDTAIFWIEFAGRHPSLSYSSPAAKVPLYQYLYLDVIAVLLTVFFVPFIALLSICCRRSKSAAKPKPQKSKQKPKKA